LVKIAAAWKPVVSAVAVDKRIALCVVAQSGAVGKKMLLW
jgi:hypothetical protein